MKPDLLHACATAQALRRAKTRHVNVPIRHCVFRPYSKGAGPVFRLTLWDTGRRDEYGKRVLGYELEMQNAPRAKFIRLFWGEDYHCAPSYAPDSDGSVEGVMGFLTLKPGDTDSDYFKDYTPAQLAYCKAHAEALAGEVQARFCDENGNVKA